MCQWYVTRQCARKYTIFYFLLDPEPENISFPMHAKKRRKYIEYLLLWTYRVES